MSEISIRVNSRTLFGDLTTLPKSQGLVIFVHGSGSSRHSSRNQFVAKKLQSRGFSTLLFDLLTLQEETIDDRTSELRFNITFLTERLLQVTDWVTERHQLPLGYFGASTGAAAALMAASLKKVEAIVSRGGRPDLAEKKALSQVKAATLLIVGELDGEVIELNKTAFDSLKCTKKMEIVPGATHLFEEPGKLEIVAKLAGDWFDQYLV